MAKRKPGKGKSSAYPVFEFGTVTYLVVLLLVFLGSWFLLSIHTLADVTAPPPCTATGFVKDGIDLTAALYNPPGVVSGDVNASGCDIGVYYDNATGAVVDASIHGARYFGVLVNGTGFSVSANVRNSNIYQIGDLPFDGSQHGVAVYYTSGDTTNVSGDVSGNTIYMYQKGGVVVSGKNSAVNVTQNTVNGSGPVNYIAQNGVQFGFGASGSVSGNEIKNNYYTGTVGVGPNPGGQNPPGWQYTSGGLLLYQAGNVKYDQNHFSGNQKNLEMVP